MNRAAGRLAVENLAPIVLLFDKTAPDVSRLLASLIEVDDDIFHYEGAESAGSNFRLLHHGIEYLLAIGLNSVEASHFDKIFCDSNISSAKTALTLNLGGNLAGGQFVAPIVQNLLMFAAKLASTIEAMAVAWMPSKLLSDVAYFSSTVEAYAKGGAFPALSTVKMEFIDEKLRTSGLAWFARQELELTGEGMSQADLMRRAVRIVYDVATNGPVLISQDVPDLEEGRIVRLNLSSDGKQVSAEITSSLEHLQV
jgi:hypothetical protein